MLGVAHRNAAAHARVRAHSKCASMVVTRCVIVTVYNGILAYQGFCLIQARLYTDIRERRTVSDIGQLRCYMVMLQ